MTAPALDVDIADLVGAMPRKACECEHCETHRRSDGLGCDRTPKWAVRIHTLACTSKLAEPDEIQVMLCGPCFEATNAWALGAVHRRVRCGCGKRVQAVTDLVGPVVHL